MSRPWGNRLSPGWGGFWASAALALWSTRHHRLSLPYTRNSFVLMKEERKTTKIQKEEGGRKGEDQVLTSQSQALCPGWLCYFIYGFQNHTRQVCDLAPAGG